jgi:hypothetical protein
MSSLTTTGAVASRSNSIESRKAEAANDNDFPRHRPKRLLKRSRPRRCNCEFTIKVQAWLGRNFLSRIGLIETNPGPQVDFTKLKGTRVFHLNVGSRLDTRIDQIKDILVKFSHKTIFTMTETGLTKNFPNDVLCAPNFKFYRHDNDTRKSLGIITYWSKDIKLESTQIFANHYTTIIIHVFKLGLDKIFFGTVYRLPEGNFDHEFSPYLENVLQSIVHSERQVLLIGDINIDLLKNGRKQSEYIDTLETFDMKQHVRRATRNCGTSSTLIDHIASTTSTILDQIANSNVMISDHHLIGCRLKSFGFKTRNPIVYQKCRLHTIGNGLNFSKCNIQNLIEDLTEIDWTEFESTLCVETMWRIFSNTLLQKLQKFTPKYACKCGKRSNRRPTDQPWYTQELKTCRHACDTAYKLYCRNGKTHYLYDQYRVLRNRYNANKERARQHYYTGLIQNCNSYTEKWQIVNAIRGKKTNENTKIDQLSTPHGNITETNAISNALNEYFATIGANTLAEVNDEANAKQIPAHPFPRNSPKNSFKFQVPTAHTVERAFQKIKTNKPAGPTGIPPSIVKALAPIICTQITHLFGACILTAKIPNSFKEAHVSPIFKKGERSDPCNYRPISVTGVFSKLFEQILLWQIESHMERYKVLAPSQYGFRRNHSTTHAMIDSLEFAYSSLNKRADAFVSFLYLDLSKAFDCIDHQRLRIAFDAIGFDEHSNNLMTSYLNNRSQAVKIEGKISEIFHTNCGIAQGSLLGPIIFSIYVNDCYRVLHNDYTKIVQYADDVAIITSAPNQIALKNHTERNLLAAKSYFTSLGLRLNVSKTQYVPSTNSHAIRNELLEDILNEHLDPGQQVHAQQTANHLGLKVDHQLNFVDHKQAVLAKLKSALGLIRSIRNKLTPAMADNLYNTLFLGTHDYAAAVYGTTGYGTGEIGTQLEIVHRKMIKCVYNDLPWDISNHDLYKISGKTTLETRRKILATKMTQSCVHKHAPINLNALFQRSEATDRAIEQIRLIVPLPIRTNLFKNSLSFRGSSIWNTLPMEIRVVESVGQFANRLTAFLQNR